MKKKISVVLCLMAFAAMSIGSGSSDSDSKTVSTSVSVEAENDKKANDSSNSSSTSTSTSTSSGTSTDTSSSNTTSESSSGNSKEEGKGDNFKFEITDSRFEYYENTLGTTEFYGIVEVTNTGDCDIYMDNCTFDLEDNDGHLLQSEDFISSCPQVVAPGEKGYFFNGLGSNTIDSGVSMDNGIKLVPQAKISKAEEKPHLYPVSDVSIKQDDIWGTKITGRVENDTQEDISYLSVYILLLDSKGKVLAITTTTVDDIGPGNKGSFDTDAMFSNSNIKFEDIADTKVIAEESYYQF